MGDSARMKSGGVPTTLRATGQAARPVRAAVRDGRTRLTGYGANAQVGTDPARGRQDRGSHPVAVVHGAHAARASPDGTGGTTPASSHAAPQAPRSRSCPPHPTARRLRVFDRDHRRGRMSVSHRHGGSPPAAARRSTPLSPSARCGRYTVRAPAATHAPANAACATTTTNAARIGW